MSKKTTSSEGAWALLDVAAPLLACLASEEASSHALSHAQSVSLTFQHMYFTIISAPSPSKQDTATYSWSPSREYVIVIVAEVLTCSVVLKAWLGGGCRQAK